jgi:hypothetical protein
MDGAAANAMEIGDPQELAAEDGVKKLIEAAEGLGVVDNKAATMTIEEMLERAKRMQVQPGEIISQTYP